MKVTSYKNGGDSAAEVINNVSYSKAQQALARAVSKHIRGNPNTQPIESVTIKWKAPTTREYDYVVEGDGSTEISPPSA